jgi:hypothetical protein
MAREEYRPPKGTRARVGTKIQNNIYLVLPDGKGDWDIGRMDTPELGVMVAEALNQYLEHIEEWM